MTQTVVGSKKKKWLIGIIVSQPLLIVLVVLMLIGLFITVFWVPFLLFAEKGDFDLGSGANYSWWTAPTKVDANGQPYLWPVPTVRYITSGYMDAVDRDAAHLGIDIASEQGAGSTELQPIYAMAAGTVLVAGSASGYGVMVSVDHGGGLVSIYGHLETALNVRPGDKVEQGQLLGRIGKGKVGKSTGPHLHFQVELNGMAVPPLEYVQPPTNVVPIELAYQKMNITLMQEWLEKRNSALANAELLAAIDRAGQSQNVSPYLLIAITGQEQSFVPKDGNHADQILKNPWNVFGCWCSGQGATLTTGESASIAAKTVVKLSQNRPAGADPIAWLNDPSNPQGVYAEHRGWYLGVSRFFKSILAEVAS